MDSNYIIIYKNIFYIFFTFYGVIFYKIANKIYIFSYFDKIYYKINIKLNIKLKN